MRDCRSTALVSAPRDFAAGSVGSSGSCAAAGIPAAARLWAWLAVGSLVVAGLLSLAVVIGRLPWVSPLIADPLFFKRCLVVHVDLALLVWFYAFLATLGALRTPTRKKCPVPLATPLLAAAGVVAMIAGAFAPGAQPVLANYIPVIDHPIFLTGLAVFFGAVVLFFIRILLAPSPGNVSLLPDDARNGVAAAGMAVILAAATYVASRAAMPAGLEAHAFFELSTWGAGHVLQAANVCGMLAVWLWMLHRITGRQVLTARASGILFAVLLAPYLAAPLLTARGTQDPLYIRGMTELMRWGIFPVVTIILVAALRHLRGGKVDGAVARALRAGFAASATLVVIGFVLGAMIRESTTLIPAHYHAALGAVTAAFMAGVFLLIEADSSAVLSRVERLWRAAWRQLPLYGVGQAIFAAGFALGGLYGLGRKTYGAEQHVRSSGEIAGIGVMGLGGLLAIVAGVWFLFLTLREMKAWRGAHS